MLRLLAPIMLFAALVHAQGRTPLQGNVAGYLESGEYIIKSVITVPAGETFRLQAGAALYFEQFTGIEVFGELQADGEAGKPVLLTSVNDTAGSPEPAQPFDWNGITTQTPDAAVTLRHTVISHSVYGVNVRNPDARAEFVNVIFQNNGYTPLAKGDRIAPITAGKPFSERWNIAEDTPPLPSRAITTAADSASRNERGGSRKRTIINATAISAATAGAIISGIHLAQMNGNFKRYSENPNPSQSQKDSVWGNISASTAGTALTGAALICLGVTLFF